MAAGFSRDARRACVYDAQADEYYPLSTVSDDSDYDRLILTEAGLTVVGVEGIITFYPMHAVAWVEVSN
jgi:hypothetical protein